MRRGRAAAIVHAALVSLVLAAAGYALATPFQDPAAGVRVTTLENGLTILTLEDHGTPVVSFQIWARVGSGDEARFTGLAHLFEHMMFRGSAHLAKERHSQLIEERGGEINAYTSRDETVYHTNITAEHLPLVIALEAERLGFLDVSEESLADERQVVIEERRFRTENNPEGRLFEALIALSFQAHPYRVPTIGWMSDLEKMGVAECRAFFDEYYAANNLVVAVAGDFETEAVLAELRTHFGSLRRAERIERNPTEEPAQTGERRAVVQFEVAGPIVAMAWHAPATGHPDTAALDVASEVLSSGRTSRMYRALVYDEPIALGAAGGYWELARAGLFYAYAQVRPGVSADVAEARLVREIERLRSEPVSAAELAKAKRALEVGLIAGQGSSHALASRIAGDWIAFGRVRPLAERLEAVRAVSAADVQRVAETWLEPTGRSVVQLLPPPEAKPASGSRP
jgi:predicted Zn-dependent peptidase